MPVLTQSTWDIFLNNFPNAHILQTGSWGELKQSFGWQTERIAITPADASAGFGAQVLFKPLPLGLCLAYIPRGPVCLASRLDHHPLWPKWLEEVDQLCRKRNAIFLKIEPDLWRCDDDLAFGREERVPDGFKVSRHDIQPPRTLIVDLSGGEDVVLSKMKQKTRYNIKLAAKKEVVIKPTQDIKIFHHLMLLTGQRDMFGVHSLAYYQKVFDLFSPSEACQVFVAEYDGEPLAAIMVFFRDRRAWYFYGASSNEQRERMPAYLLQWEAMRWARAKGCDQYDLWGVPDYQLQNLEDNFLKQTKGLWGVYRFKRGFGGELKRVQGPWDRVYKPFWYSLYLKWISLREQQDEI